MMELSQPKLLGWTYCVTNLLVSWGEIVAVFVGVGRALVSLASSGCWNGWAISFLWRKVPVAVTLRSPPGGLSFLTLFHGGLFQCWGLRLYSFLSR